MLPHQTLKLLMAKIITLIIFLSVSTTLLFSQSDSTKKRIDPNNISTQGEQEKYWAQKVFDGEYNPQFYELYKGGITYPSEKTFNYDGSIIRANFPETDYQIIFERGILYPSLFTGENDGRVLKNLEISDSQRKNSFFALWRTDSLYIGIMEDLQFLNPSNKIKRYKLYLGRPGLANSSMYIFELTNENATDKTELKTFLKEARLTYLKFVSILI